MLSSSYHCEFKNHAQLLALLNSTQKIVNYFVKKTMSKVEQSKGLELENALFCSLLDSLLCL
jgi:hypothetical protein